MRRVPVWLRWILVIAAIRFALALAVPLLAEETYHWNFARHLDWSYYDHPPMIAWAIALGRLVLGDTRLGIRFVPLLFSIGTAILVARLALRMYGERAAMTTVLLLSIQPVTFLASGSGFPDAALLFFWAITLCCVWQAVESASGPWWLAAGAALGAAMLSKYTAVFLVPSVLIYMVLSKRDRRWLATPWPYLAGLVSVIVFAPVLYWNATHEWASFRFQSTERFAQAKSLDPQAWVNFIFGQWAGILPLTLPLAVVSFWKAIRSEGSERRFLFWTTVPMFGFFFGLGLFRVIHAMWPLPAHLGGAVLMAGVLERGEGRLIRFYAKARIWLVGLTCLAFLLAALHAVFIIPGLPPIKDLYGWKEVATRARQIRTGMPDGGFYVGIGRSYTCASQLAFHLQAPYEVYAGNVLGERSRQYDYWVRPEALAGRDAVIVIEGDSSNADYAPRLSERFESVEKVSEVLIPLGRGRRPLKFFIYAARHYH